jgi:hypothetical protein
VVSQVVWLYVEIAAEDGEVGVVASVLDKFRQLETLRDPVWQVEVVLSIVLRM